MYHTFFFPLTILFFYSVLVIGLSVFKYFFLIMVENQCKARPVKAYIMISDLLKRFDSEATNDAVKLVIAVVGFYIGLFYCKYIINI